MANILIVDDAVFMRKVLTDLLVSDGHEVVGVASNGKEAIALYETLKPDLVTLDIIMPEMDGINAKKAIKAILQLNKCARILMVSAMGHDDLIKEFVQMGAKDFIVKPFRPSMVTKMVTQILTR